MAVLRLAFNRIDNMLLNKMSQDCGENMGKLLIQKQVFIFNSVFNLLIFLLNFELHLSDTIITTELRSVPSVAKKQRINRYDGKSSPTRTMRYVIIVSPGSCDCFLFRKGIELWQVDARSAAVLDALWYSIWLLFHHAFLSVRIHKRQKANNYCQRQQGESEFCNRHKKIVVPFNLKSTNI